MRMVIYVLCFLFIASIIISVIVSIVNDKAAERDWQLWKNKLRGKYGNETLVIRHYSRPTPDNTVLVYDNHKVIIVNGLILKYSDIIDFNVNNEMSYKTSTSTGSVVGRGLVGGLLLGGVGALAGATTANKNTTAKVSEYRINIILRDMNNPLVTCVLIQEDHAQKMVAVLKNIIDYNDKEKLGNKC